MGEINVAGSGGSGASMELIESGNLSMVSSNFESVSLTTAEDLDDCILIFSDVSLGSTNGIAGSISVANRELWFNSVNGSNSQIYWEVWKVTGARTVDLIEITHTSTLNSSLETFNEDLSFKSYTPVVPEKTVVMKCGSHFSGNSFRTDAYVQVNSSGNSLDVTLYSDFIGQPSTTRVYIIEFV